jgi:hypothetical protein
MTNRKGTYYRWHPADGAILELLPIEGSAIGYHPIAATVSQMLITLNKDVPEEGRLNKDQIGSRLRSMKTAGMTVSVSLSGNSHAAGWQRTRRGELTYAEQTGKTLGGPPDLRRIEGGTT